MIEIKDLLLRFNKLIDNEEIKISLIRESILEVLKIDIPKNKIFFKNGILKLDINSIYKNEIFLNWEKISKKIGEKSNVKNIRKVF
ncbi:MAG: hypothetical protein KBD14_00225 [Candidatus Pacebacteria bacterium]|nr:hypothetical protein [Candidatus Paceibacterota bacterium]